MKVHLHADKHVVLDAELSERLEAGVADRLERFQTHLTRVEMHLSDQGAGKRSGADVRCNLEARPAGLQPLAVSDSAPTVAAAIDGAVEKLVALLGSTFERLEDRGARETIRGR